MFPAEDLTTHQIHTVTTLERDGGLVSLVAVALILLTYALVRRVRNVQNTFIVFASSSNVGASIAFMQSDPRWSLAMAVNVLLVFYFRASPDSSGAGSTQNGTASASTPTTSACGHICIAGSILCYVLVGYHVFRSPNRLYSFSAMKSWEEGSRHIDDTQRRSNHHQQDPAYGIVTAEVRIPSPAGSSQNSNPASPPALLSPVLGASQCFLSSRSSSGEKHQQRDTFLPPSPQPLLHTARIPTQIRETLPMPLPRNSPPRHAEEGDAAMMGSDVELRGVDMVLKGGVAK
ncbi:hypothetical protein E4U54_004325 [Claviceps lovelessii]|nr:hypothetical protein E4U54_004325 [Claviceps lovelessii]